MQCKVALLKADDNEGLLVVLDSLERVDDLNGPFSSNAKYTDENLFIEKVLLANLGEEETVDLIASTLLAAADRLHANHWVSLDLTEETLIELGLNPYGSFDSAALRDRLRLSEDLHLQSVLLQAPLAVTMVSGPQHRFTFINPPYVKVLGRANSASLLGKEVRKALPELEGQPFFGLLDGVYRTGKPHIGVEVRAEILNEETGQIEETYFDFIYHPLRDQDGTVTGILCMASVVRERVLSRQVSESRERQLFRQWAELETIYKQSPIGMCLLDSRDYRILRVNDIQAELMGAPVSELLGKRVLDIFPDISVLQELYERVAAGEAVTNYPLTTDLPGARGVSRTWLLNFTPVLDVFGNVEMIASTALEVTPRELTFLN